MEELDVFYPKNQAEWRQWLEKNHLSQQSVWVVFHTKASGKPSLTWSESVDVALCFGWIDSKKVKIDAERSRQFFCKRKTETNTIESSYPSKLLQFHTFPRRFSNLVNAVLTRFGTFGQNNPRQHHS